MPFHLKGDLSFPDALLMETITKTTPAAAVTRILTIPTFEFRIQEKKNGKLKALDICP